MKKIIFTVIITLLIVSVGFLGYKYYYDQQTIKELNAVPTPTPEIVYITPTPAPESTVSKISNVPTISKQPTAETKKVGENTQFIIEAENYTEITWYIITPTDEEIAAEDLNKYFNPAYTAGYDTDTISVCNIQEKMNGMKFYAHLVGKSGGIDSDTITLTVNTAATDSVLTDGANATTTSSIYVVAGYTPPSTIPAAANYVVVRQGNCSSNFYCNGTLITTSNSITLPSTSTFVITNEAKTSCSVSVATSAGVVYSKTATQHTFYIDPNIEGDMTVNAS